MYNIVHVVKNVDLPPVSMIVFLLDVELFWQW